MELWERNKKGVWFRFLIILWFRISGVEFRVQGSGFRVYVYLLTQEERIRDGFLDLELKFTIGNSSDIESYKIETNERIYI